MSIQLILSLVIFFFCLTIHEFAHGLMAEKCGDSTARYLGRLTLNPLAHIDPFGTVFLPLILIMTGSPFVFGWAKPVPINPYNFHHPRADSVKVGLAGPGANIMAAVFFAIIFRLIHYYNFAPLLFVEVLMNLVLLNLVLAIFNLIPVPPLDGSHVLASLLPSNLAYKYERLQSFGFIIIFILMFLGFFNRVIFPLAEFLTKLFMFY